MSICLNPNQWSRRYRHGDMVNDRNAEYQATVYDVLPHSLSRYLSITQGCGYVVIMKPHGSGYKLVGEVKRNQQCPRINYHRDEIRVPISNGYPVITIDYAIIPVNVYDHPDHTLINHIITPQLSIGPVSEIPHIIHQTFETLVVHNKLKLSIDRLIDIYPDFQYQYHTGVDCEQFIRDNFDDRVLQAYRNLYAGAFKADLWRVCQLYITGGMYVDVKMYAVESLRDIIENHDLVLVIDIDPNMIYNAFMASKPQCSFLKMVIDEIVTNVENRYYGEGSDSWLDVTGPLTVGKCLERYLGYKVTTSGSYIHSDGTRYYILNHKFLPGKDYRTVYDNEVEYLYHRHPEHPIDNDECYHSTGKLHYGDLYRQHRIYTDENQ